MEQIKEEIKAFISHSTVPEDPAHAEDTLAWLLKLEPNADQALQIAALGHDIERADEEKKVKREDFPDFEAFKDAHARNSARVLKELMERLQMEQETLREVCRLVTLHESGGDLRADLLRDADSLSFFHVNLPRFLEREGWENTLKRCQWGYRRLSPRAKRLIHGFKYENPSIHRMLGEAFREGEKG